MDDNYLQNFEDDLVLDIIDYINAFTDMNKNYRQASGVLTDAVIHRIFSIMD